MTRDELLETAKVLPPFTTASAHEYSARREAIVMEINQLLLQRPDIHLMVGASNIDMMRDNHANHARFVESLLLHYSAETLVETVLWVFRAYRSHGFHLTYWPAQLNAWVSAPASAIAGILRRDLPALPLVYYSHSHFRSADRLPNRSTDAGGLNVFASCSAWSMMDRR